MIPAQRPPLDDQAGPDAKPVRAVDAATVNLGSAASAWPGRIAVAMTIAQDRPTYRATVHVQPMTSATTRIGAAS